MKWIGYFKANKKVKTSKYHQGFAREDSSLGGGVLPRWHGGKEFTYQCRRCGFNPCIGAFPGGGNGNLFQYSCLENSMDREAWRATVHRIAKQLDRTEHTHTLHWSWVAGRVQPGRNWISVTMLRCWRASGGRVRKTNMVLPWECSTDLCKILGKFWHPTKCQTCGSTWVW